MLVTLLKDKKNRPVNYKQKVQLIRVIFDFVLVNKKKQKISLLLQLHSTGYSIFVNSQNTLFYKQIAEHYSWFCFLSCLTNEQRVIVIHHIEQERQQLLWKKTIYSYRTFQTHKSCSIITYTCSTPVEGAAALLPSGWLLRLKSEKKKDYRDIKNISVKLSTAS